MEKDLIIEKAQDWQRLREKQGQSNDRVSALSHIFCQEGRDRIVHLSSFLHQTPNLAPHISEILADLNPSQNLEMLNSFAQVFIGCASPYLLKRSLVGENPNLNILNFIQNLDNELTGTPFPKIPVGYERVAEEAGLLRPSFLDDQVHLIRGHLDNKGNLIDIYKFNSDGTAPFIQLDLSTFLWHYTGDAHQKVLGPVLSKGILFEECVDMLKKTSQPSQTSSDPGDLDIFKNFINGLPD